MTLQDHIRKFLLPGFLLAVIITFFCLRPLSSPWHPFIAGDGLGYYSHLPATFIYHDTHYEYEWFNKVHNANYTYSTFENPEDNLLVKYGDRKVNKYYQGLAFVWMPFFFVAHGIAKVTGFEADGYSQPYQLMIGLASLIYLCTGLVFLWKLIFRLFRSDFISLLVTSGIFFGTHLFTYAISANTLSHAYSFSFIAGLFYYVVVFAENSRNLKHLLLSMLFLVLTVCIRPLNGLIVLPVLAFLRQKPSWREMSGWGYGSFLIILVMFSAICFQVYVTYMQTGSLIAYTYTDEKFHFDKPRFLEALFSYHLGLFVYVPLLLLSFIGLVFMRWRKGLLLAGFFFGVLFLYSCWWYWPIVKRAMIDFYAIPAIFLGALLKRFTGSKIILVVVSALLILCIGYYQLKRVQVNNGILDEFNTYGEVFWRNFFRTEKANMYLVPPGAISAKVEEKVMFENEECQDACSQDRSYSGKTAMLFDGRNYIRMVREFRWPGIFEKTGGKKIRLSFRGFFEEGVKTAHVFLQFMGKDRKVLLEVPFYINEDYIFPGKWDFKEFGYEITDPSTLNGNTVETIGVVIWNVEAKSKIYIDDLKLEFLLLNDSFEIIK